MNLLAHDPGIITSFDVTVNIPLQLSEATTAPVFGAGTSLAHDTETLEGILLIIGAMMSATFIVCVTVVLLPLQSVIL
mgnify:CR=1 FL=1